MNIHFFRSFICLTSMLILVSCEEKKEEQDLKKVMYYLQLTSKELNNGMKSVEYLKEYQKHHELVLKNPISPTY